MPLLISLKNLNKRWGCVCVEIKEQFNFQLDLEDLFQNNSILDVIHLIASKIELLVRFCANAPLSLLLRFWMWCSHSKNHLAGYPVLNGLRMIWGMEWGVNSQTWFFQFIPGMFLLMLSFTRIPRYTTQLSSNAQQKLSFLVCLLVFLTFTLLYYRMVHSNFLRWQIILISFSNENVILNCIVISACIKSIPNLLYFIDKYSI